MRFCDFSRCVMVTRCFLLSHELPYNDFWTKNHLLFGHFWHCTKGTSMLRNDSSVRICCEHYFRNVYLHFRKLTCVFLYSRIFTAHRYASAIYAVIVSVCATVTVRYHIETATWIEPSFFFHISFPWLLLHSVLRTLGYHQIEWDCPSGTLSQTLALENLASVDKRRINIKFHGSSFLVASSGHPREDVANKSRGNRACRTRILAMMSRGCYAENGR